MLGFALNTHAYNAAAGDAYNARTASCCEHSPYLTDQSRTTLLTPTAVACPQTQASDRADSFSVLNSVLTMCPLLCSGPLTSNQSHVLNFHALRRNSETHLSKI